MRHKTKKEIICILDTLQKAQDKVVKLLRKGSYIGEANKVLVECQRCAIQVGESIEKSEGVGTKAVSVLEAYCEYLYLMSENTDRKSLLALKEQMDNALHQVKCEVQENLPADPLKVVFMPYKASMWDCMESVWEAADVDERCDAYVVPIPFYEKNQQGNTINDCYEGNSFPAYVPITDYRAFSLEEEQPDVIYIHNPFDGANYVTSVHPEYYSSNLKHFTDYLVYIPYYILGKGLLPQTHMNLPAYQYADKIIVQDDEKAESLKDYVPEEKIIVMGSPKVDRLLKLNRKKREIIENEIPEEWRRKIKGKKVILFNVSVSGILKNSKYTLDKIQYVISRFENRDDVVLIWRPHPLVEATLKSMRTEMYAKYIKIKKKFVRSGKGILDETGDVGVTVIVSDAYLGENSSSLIHYFGVLGKPVMFIDWKVVKEETEEERRALPVYDFYIENESVFFVPGKVGMEHYLYKLDLKTGDLCVDTKFPGTASYEIKDYLCINKYT
ncbi:hypothetical protein IMSAGC019_02216 [Lachnospiraceae bacterium]|nr:hypothetical protein IMSAGC019_02216 [Lachnospiraceae bacterium]